jgi:Family of unknown function (DUF6370)
MRMMSKMAVVAVLALAVAGLAVAEDAVTLQGKVVCAKCVLKNKDFKECQNVLVVSQAAGQEAKDDVQYYIVNNEVGKKFGEVCTDAKKTTVTGTVADKDGLKWITPSKMEPIS